MKFSLGLIASLFFLNGAQASGYNIGNGGDVLICQSGSQLPPVVLLDLVELQYRYKFTIASEVQAGASREEVLSILFHRIELRYPAYVLKLRAMYSQFWKLTKFSESGSFPSLKDEGLALQVDGCSLQQIAINFTDPIQQMKYKYIIDARLWRQLSSPEQALLILHELIYREEVLRISSSDKTSEHIRKIVALVASNYFYAPQYEELLAKQFGGH